MKFKCEAVRLKFLCGLCTVVSLPVTTGHKFRQFNSIVSSLIQHLYFYEDEIKNVVLYISEQGSYQLCVIYSLVTLYGCDRSEACFMSIHFILLLFLYCKTKVLINARSKLDSIISKTNLLIKLLFDEFL